MEEKIFRETSMERVSSPEQLDDYIRVTSPGMWMVMGAVVLLLAGVCLGDFRSAGHGNKSPCCGKGRNHFLLYKGS